MLERTPHQTVSCGSRIATGRTARPECRLLDPGTLNGSTSSWFAGGFKLEVTNEPVGEGESCAEVQPPCLTSAPGRERSRSMSIMNSSLALQRVLGLKGMQCRGGGGVLNVKKKRYRRIRKQQDWREVPSTTLPCRSCYCTFYELRKAHFLPQLRNLYVQISFCAKPRMNPHTPAKSKSILRP